MGKPDDPRSVVDSSLKVLGMKGLRVMDLSVMPVIITTNTQAPALMIGEKGSDILLRQWKGISLLDSRSTTKPFLSNSL